MTPEMIEQKHQEDLQRLRGFRLLDDDFLTKCFEGNTECIELVLRIVMEMPDLKVIDVHTQVFVENLLNRSVRLDVLATDSTGRKINVEIQRSDKGAGRKRARYNSSMMDANLLEKGEEGVAIMCKVIEDMRNQERKETIQAVALRMLKAGKYALEEIADISGLPLDEVKALSTNKTA